MDKSFVRLALNLDANVRRDTMGGKEYLVCPIVMITEGVHNGTQGPMYYPPEELAKDVAAWNMKPIVVYHPQLGQSACQPEIINNRGVGFIFNTSWDDDANKLRAEAWLEDTRLDEVDERIRVHLEESILMECSTGVYVDRHMEAGVWNEESYDAIARNYRPDHLALLPDKAGACSIADGAGLLQLNHSSKESGVDKSSLVTRALGRLETRFHLTNNALSHDNIREGLRTALRERINPADDAPWPWVEDVYDTFFIYELGPQLYKLGYSVSDTTVTLSEDEPMLVVRVTEYRTVSGEFVGNTNGELPSAITKDDTMDKEKLVGDLIANEKTPWEESDKETLMSFAPEKLEALVPTANADTDPPKDPPADKPADTTNNADKTPVSADEYVANAPEEIREMLSDGLQAHTAERNRLTGVITANESNQFEEAELKDMSLNHLRKLASVAAPKQQDDSLQQSYFGAQGTTTPANNSASQTPLGLPSLDFSK